MPRELYPEHHIVTHPDVIEMCDRCKGGPIYRPFQSRPVCHKCGDAGRNGEVYIKAAALVDALMKMASTAPGLPQVVVAIRHLFPEDRFKLDALTGPRLVLRQDPKRKR